MAQSITEIINQEIQYQVPAMIEEALNAQTHNGSDSQQIIGSNLANAPQPAISPITTTGAFGVDPATVATVNQILVQLKALGLFN